MISIFCSVQVSLDTKPRLFTMSILKRHIWGSRYKEGNWQISATIPVASMLLSWRDVRCLHWNIFGSVWSVSAPFQILFTLTPEYFLCLFLWEAMTLTALQEKDWLWWSSPSASQIFWVLRSQSVISLACLSGSNYRVHSSDSASWTWTIQMPGMPQASPAMTAFSQSWGTAAVLLPVCTSWHAG